MRRVRLDQSAAETGLDQRFRAISTDVLNLDACVARSTVVGPVVLELRGVLVATPAQELQGNKSWLFGSIFNTNRA